MKIVIGFSPCPNDTFIFDALVNRKIDTGDLRFEAQLEDVETLNQLALDGVLPFTKISYAVLSRILNSYVVLNSGSALGSGVGPLLIANNQIPKDEINDCLIAIPGEHTTAHMLFALAFPDAKNKIFLRYDEIEEFVLSAATPPAFNRDNKSVRKAGVIIHENRFTYEKKGLIKIIDLGDFWQNKTGSPIPLGGIVGKRTMDPHLLYTVDNLIKKSIEFAYEHYPELTDYVRENSREMEEDVMRKHIDLYVNKYSLSLGTEGQNAVSQFLRINQEMSGSDQSAKQVFLSATLSSGEIS
jgi:Predicted periplasmic solute-binding protein